MKTYALDVTRFIAVLAAVATAAFSAGGIRTAAAEECTGPFRQCAIGVGAKCERTPQGTQKIVYYDYPGRVMSFETCVGRIFEAAAQPNPYKPAPAGGQSRRTAGSANLSLPDSDLISPLVDR